MQINIIKKVKAILPAILFPIITFYLLEFFINNPFTDMKLPAHFLNITLFLLLAALLFFLFGRLRTALMAESIFFLIAGLANYFVLQFRSAPIMPWDIFSLKTAASVAGNFKYSLDKSAVFAIIGFLLLIAAEFFFTNHSYRPNWKKRSLGAAAAMVCLFCFTLVIHEDSSVYRFKLYDKLFTPTVMSKRDGTAIAFLMQMEYAIVKKPSGYNADHSAFVLDSYAAEPAMAEAISTPNIIVIMNEAFSDPSVLGSFTTNQPYIPFMDSLMREGANTVSGYLHTSVLGGNTANTEFEFLTGNSMAFLPQGSIPYQQYIKTETPSLASYLKSFGYTTIGMHPYNSGGWDRDTVYPMLGLDTNYFLKDFKNPKYVRNYVSDQSNYDKIIECYEQKQKGQPLFLFNVTMQNHSAYTETFDNFTPDISVNGTDNVALNQYLSLLHLSDLALEEIISYFEAQEEETIIVFFGDHQPTNSVVEPVWKLNGKSGGSLTEEEETRRYEVPYVIWANYPIEEAAGMDTSVNYLAAQVLKTAGLPLSEYASFLNEFRTRFPIVTAVQTTDSFGVSTPTADREEELNVYESLQYYQLFGNE